MRTPDPLKTPRRIAIAGDWHSDTAWACSAVWYAADQGADVVIQVGDFGYQFTPTFLNNLNHTLSASRRHLLFIEGNHENHRWLNQQPLHDNGLRPLREWIWHIPRGYRWTWDGIRFLGLGGAHSVDGIWRRQNMLLWQHEERITEEQAEKVIADGPADVLISHDCPQGVPTPMADGDRFPPIEIMRAEEHRMLLRHVVDAVQPRRIWHGHYHTRYDAESDFGYGPVQVTGLHMNGTSLRENVQVVDLDRIGEDW